MLLSRSFVKKTDSFLLFRSTVACDRATDHRRCKCLVDIVCCFETTPLLLTGLHFNLEVLLRDLLDVDFIGCRAIFSTVTCVRVTTNGG